MKVQVWEQGYDMNGDHGTERLAWEGEAEHFLDACNKLLEERTAAPEKWGNASKLHRYENGHHSWWGCGWFRTREEAL